MSRGDMELQLKLFALCLLVVPNVLSIREVQKKCLCNSEWRLVYENNPSGGAVHGNKYALLAAILAGARVRVSTGDYVAEADGIYVHDGHAHAELLQHVSKATWMTFQADAYWYWTILATTGFHQNIRYNVGSSTPRGVTTNTRGTKWYVKSSFTSLLPVYANNKAGQAVSGTLGQLKAAVSAGQDIRAITEGSYQFPMQNVAFDNKVVAGQFLDHISKATSGATIQFQPNPYWWFTIISTSGKRDMSRWSVGTHTSRGHTSDTVSTEWFADPCWQLAYGHDTKGNAIQGSLNGLITAIQSGRRIRIQLGSSGAYTTEADNLSIIRGQVTAQALKHVSKASLETFQGDAYWWWLMVSTTGTVRMRRYDVEGTRDRGSTKTPYTVKWFVDTRPWSLALAHNEQGTPLAGSRAGLVKAVRAGAAVRIVQIDGAYAFPAQNLQVDPTGSDVAAQTLNSVSMQEVAGASEMEIQPNPYWWFTIVTSRGERDMSRWSVGAHVSRGNSKDRVGLKWFVQK
ncbi:predicted protein [Nematostella vectensis]|uniref:Uncharacterized protein n=1 Tax=Nematostella vectensis TaxID=45351 RepID=A7RQD5_NEMVE|nr:uncharacterized protein LOC5518450 isoform X2 [Nematostella vectensis]EDO46271.1 predicted protein [Nematostella vectensis]|eukprot:XP_001638334.1 predicted protein [Nematostella vectensis]